MRSKRLLLLLTVLLVTAAVAAAQTITSVSPVSVAAGSSAFALTVNGTGFNIYTKVQWNGQNRYTILMSPTTLRALISTTDVGTAGTAVISTLNTATGAVSNKVSFTITAPAGTPTPTPTPTPIPTPTPTPSKIAVTVTSPVQNQSVCSPVTLIASATTSNAGAQITSWKVFDEVGNQLWATLLPSSSVKPSFTLPAGPHTLQIKAWDSTGTSGYTSVAFNVTTATPPCGGNTGSSGFTVQWHGCWYSTGGHRYQAIQFQLSQPETLVLQGEMYDGPSCDPANWFDQLNDFKIPTNFGSDWGYTYWFVHFPDDTNTSVIWTLGTQTSGCINYNVAPACN